MVFKIFNILRVKGGGEGCRMVIKFKLKAIFRNTVEKYICVKIVFIAIFCI